jgi:hypothetical protein
MKKWFSVEQIVRLLKEAEVDVPAVKVIRKTGISEQMFYHRKKQYVAWSRTRSGRSCF